MIACLRDSIAIYLFLFLKPDDILFIIELSFSVRELSSVIIENDELLSTIFAVMTLFDGSRSPPHPKSVVI